MLARDGESSPRRDAGVALVALAAGLTMVLGLASDAIFFNSAHVSYYPFFDRWQALGALWTSGTIPSPPD